MLDNIIPKPLRDIYYNILLFRYHKINDQTRSSWSVNQS